MKPTLLYYPELAGALRELGIPHPAEAAIFLSQLSYWLKKEGCGRMTRDGKNWICNTYQKWVSQIKSLTVSQFGKMIRALARNGLIERTTYAEQRHSLKKEKPVGFSSWNNTTWVTLCIEKIKELTGWSPFENETEETSKEEKSDPRANESLESAPRANLLNRTSDNSEQNDGYFYLESPSIYKENPISYQTSKDDLEKEKNNLIDNKSAVSHPPIEVKEENPIPRPINLKQDNYPRSSQFRVNRIIDEDVVQEIWEIDIGKPFFAFLSWRANCHYKPQGGKWERDAIANAYSEFYRNRQKTSAVLFPQFMNEVRAITEKVHQAQSCEAIAANVLPSWFIESLPDATPENVRQLMQNLDAVIERGTRIALPSKSNTPSDMTVDYHEAHSQVDIKPLPQLEAPVLKGVEAPVLRGVDSQASGVDVEVPSSDLQLTLARKQAQWNAPLLRDRVRRWAENTPGVVMTESGPQLETSVETIQLEAIRDEVEINRIGAALGEVEITQLETTSDEVKTTLNNTAPGEVEMSNPVAENLPLAVEADLDADNEADIEVQLPSTSNNVDVSSSNNSPSINSNEEVENNTQGASRRSDVVTNSHCASTTEEVDTNNQLTQLQIKGDSGNGFASDEEDISSNVERSFFGADVVIDDPWDAFEPLLVEEEVKQEVRSEEQKAQPSLMKLMLALWDNIYDLGQLVLNAPESELIAAVSQCTSQQIAHIKKAATSAWYPGVNRDADYKGERVEIWEVGQSPTVKVRTKRGGFLKVRRNDLKPWLGI